MSDTVVKSWILTSEDFESILKIEMNMERYLSKWIQNHSNHYYNSRYSVSDTGYEVIIELYEEQ